MLRSKEGIGSLVGKGGGSCVRCKENNAKREKILGYEDQPRRSKGGEARNNLIMQE